MNNTFSNAEQLAKRIVYLRARIKSGALSQRAKLYCSKLIRSAQAQIVGYSYIAVGYRILGS